MNARRHTAATVLRQRATQTRAAASIRRRGEASMTTHALAAGLPIAEARTVASSLRRNAVKLGLTGTEARVHAGRRMRTTRRYTAVQVAQAAAVYRPRRPEFKTARAFLLAA